MTEMDALGYVYELVDPESGKAFYVGSTINPKRRMREHLKSCKGKTLNDNITMTQVKIVGIIAKGKIPTMNILEEVEINSQEILRRREWYWVEYKWWVEQCRLTNTANLRFTNNEPEILAAKVLRRASGFSPSFFT